MDVRGRRRFGPRLLGFPSGLLGRGTGTVTVSAGATIAATGNQVVISSGTVSITGSAVVDPTKASLVLSTGTVSAITWSEIIPGATMTWTAIDEC